MGFHDFVDIYQTLMVCKSLEVGVQYRLMPLRIDVIPEY
jgi:hypothetical protein